jgi:hypothetical protein
MSVVDRWLNRPYSKFQECRAATLATIATSSQRSCVSLAFDVANGSRQIATFAKAGSEPVPVSQSDPAGVRQEKPQNSPTVEPVLQISPTSQGPLPKRAGFSPPDEKRVPIVAHNRRMPRSWAQGYARLDPARPPENVPVRHWGQFVEDVGRFLESDFAPVAAVLGWRALDLFGADRDRPFTRIDQAGLLWLLNGDRIVALSENTATVKTRTGAPQTWRRKENQSNRALAWELK